MFTLENFILNERAVENGVSQYDIKVGQIGDKAYCDPGLYRPYRDDNGRVWVDVIVGNVIKKDKDGAVVTNSQGQPVYEPVKEPQLVSYRKSRDLPVLHVDNSTVLRKDQWLMIDAVVAQAARLRMRAWADLRAANTMGGFDGMSTPILEFERINDAGEAVVDMDAISDGNDFNPTYSLQGMPLPVTHCDFTMSQRFLAVSRRNGGPAADTTRAEMAGRRVGEMLERTYIGTQTGMTYGANSADARYSYTQTSSVYGLTNHPERITTTGATAPDGTNASTVLTEWLSHRENMYSNNFYGPFQVYTATSYDQYLDNVFSTTHPGDGTLRDRLRAIQEIQDIKRLDYLTTTGTVLWVQMGPDIKAVNGMDITTVQWPSKGGLKLNFKVLTIQAPLIKSVYINSDTDGGPASASTLKTPIQHITI